MESTTGSSLAFVQILGKLCEVTRNNDNETLHLWNICTMWTKDKILSWEVSGAFGFVEHGSCIKYGTTKVIFMPLKDFVVICRCYIELIWSNASWLEQISIYLII